MIVTIAAGRCHITLYPDTGMAVVGRSPALGAKPATVPISALLEALLYIREQRRNT